MSEFYFYTFIIERGYLIQTAINNIIGIIDLGGVIAKQRRPFKDILARMQSWSKIHNTFCYICEVNLKQ